MLATFVINTYVSVDTAADPFPWAIEECFDVYKVLVDSQGAAIGMSGKVFNTIMTGDSACVLLSLKYHPINNKQRCKYHLWRNVQDTGKP